MSKDDLEMLKSIVSDAVEDSVFGLLCVLDGVRAFFVPLILTLKNS